jgi:tetratricopeptide (TPR) repeat protein
MQYDRLGFPIPPEFVPPPDEPVASRSRGGPVRRATGAGRLKRLLLAAVVAGIVGPAVLAPVALPAARDAVVAWSAERAIAREARGQLAAAIREVSRAVRWGGDDAERLCGLLCWRAMLRLEHRDAAGAVADAGHAQEILPTSPRPLRVRALAQVVLGRPDDALAAARAAAALARPGDPEALNHRAYVRALVGRELPEALADIEAALAGGDATVPELLDTKGFLLHLLGRHHEAIDQLNLAIDGAREGRRRVASLAEGGSDDEVRRRLRSIDQGLAVMLHHRGLACRAAGLEGQAEQDLELARRKGFAPDRGIF